MREATLAPALKPAPAPAARPWLAVFEAAQHQPGRTLRLLDAGQHDQLSNAVVGGVQVIFDGYLFNRDEFARSLAMPRPGTCGDAELIAHSYHRWRDDILRHMKGVYALLIWDERREQLLCARDRIGIYPLFYASHGSNLLFSTVIERIIQQPGVSNAVNRATIASYMCRQWPALEETFYAAVKRVPPASALVVTEHARATTAYWQLARPDQDVTWVREDELEQFSVLMDQAINRCLSLGPAGIFLSGGLDSVSVAAIAKDNSLRQGLPPPLALSLIFPDPVCNEEPVQRGVAAQLGLAHVCYPFEEAVGPQGLLAAALDWNANWPAPLQNVWKPAYATLKRRALEQGCRVIVSGGGGDEWLTVTPVVAADLLRAGDVVGLARLIHGVRRSYNLGTTALLRNMLWTNGGQLLCQSGLNSAIRHGPAWLRTARRYRNIGLMLQQLPGWLAPEPSLRRLIEERAVERLDKQAQEPFPSSFYFADGVALDHWLMTTDWEEHFEGCRRAGIRVMEPFWDADLIEFLHRVPPTLLYKGGRSKGLVRNMLARRFPNLGFERQKKVLSIDFFKQSMMGGAGDAWQTLGGVTALAELGIVQRTGLEQNVREAVTGRDSGDAQFLWGVLHTEAWLRPRVIGR